MKSKHPLEGLGEKIGLAMIILAAGAFFYLFGLATQ
jgi:hypothetical protein